MSSVLICIGTAIDWDRCCCWMETLSETVWLEDARRLRCELLAEYGAATAKGRRLGAATGDFDGEPELGDDNDGEVGVIGMVGGASAAFCGRLSGILG